MTMGKSDRFQRGSGVYTCEICGRKTRSTGRGDNEHMGLCAECFDLCGYENMIYDGHEIGPVSVLEINQLYRAIITKGGKPQFAHMSYIEQEKEA